MLYLHAPGFRLSGNVSANFLSVFELSVPVDLNANSASRMRYGGFSNIIMPTNLLKLSASVCDIGKVIISAGQ